MGAFSKVAEEVNHDDAAGGLAELKSFAHICQVGPWIQRLIRQINQREGNVEEERRKLVERLAAQLYLATDARKEDKVFRKEVIRQMVKIIEDAIEIASAPLDEKSRKRLLPLRMRARIEEPIYRARIEKYFYRARIEEQIYRAAFLISTRRWVRTEEGDVVSLKRESQTAADHEASAKAKFIGELKIVKANLSSAKERYAQLEEENKILRESHEKGNSPKDGDLVEQCARLKEENENKEKRCAELEEEIRLLRGSRQRGDNPEDGDLADPNSVSPSNSVLQVVPQVPEERATVREETSTTAAPTGAERSATTEELKQEIQSSDNVTVLSFGVLVSLLIFHLANKSVEPHTLAFKAFTFLISATFACGLSVRLLTICAPPASYQKPIIRGLAYVSNRVVELLGVGVCIALLKAMVLLVFVPVIVVVIVACIIVYYKKVRSGQSLPRWRSE